MRLPLLLALLPLPALAQEAPTEWLGPEPHLVATGTISGQPVEIDLFGEAATLEARRVYRPGHAGWRHAAIEVTVPGDEPLSLVIGQQDFLQLPAPAIFAIVDMPEPEGFFADVSIATGDAEPVQPDGWLGTLTFTQDSGTRDPEQLLTGGSIGGHLDVTSGADRLVLSFTAPVAEDTREE